MSRTGFYLSLVILHFILIPGIVAQTGATASATGNISAEIIPVFTATETSQMNFGRFSPGPQGGEIILTPDGSISVLGSIFAGTGTYNPASFYVSGDDNVSYTISLPDEPVVLKHVSSSKTMLIKELMTIPGEQPGAGFLQDGFQVVYVGATLKVGTLEDNPVGIYAGTYSITFDFN